MDALPCRPEGTDGDERKSFHPGTRGSLRRKEGCLCQRTSLFCQGDPQEEIVAGEFRERIACSVETQWVGRHTQSFTFRQQTADCSGRTVASTS